MRKQLFWPHLNGSWAVHEGDWKFLQDPEGKRHLFHLAVDIREMDDLIESMPDLAARLLNPWQEWNVSNAGCIPWFP